MSYTKVSVVVNSLDHSSETPNSSEFENVLKFVDADSGEPLDNSDMLYILLDNGSYELIGDSGEVSFSSDLDHVKNGSETVGSLADLRDKIYKGPYQAITSDAVNPGYESPVQVRSPLPRGLDMQNLAAAPRRRRHQNGLRNGPRPQTRPHTRPHTRKAIQKPPNRQPTRRKRRVVVTRPASNRRRTPFRRTPFRRTPRRRPVAAARQSSPSGK